jgi:hypothetical protein
MKAEIPPDDPRLIWQNQRREHTSMSVDEARLRAYGLQTKIHRNLIVTIATGFVLLVAAAMMITSHRPTPTRLIIAVLMLFIVITINRAYRAFWSTETLPDDATPSACLDFYRSELTAQYRAAALTWRRVLPEVTVLVLLIWFSSRAAFRFSKASVLIPAFWALVLAGRYWRAYRLKRELRTLDSFEKEDNDAHDTGR